MRRIKQLFLINLIVNLLREFNQKNYTPLHMASTYNSKEIGERLISKGADINTKDIIYKIITPMI